MLPPLEPLGRVHPGLWKDHDNPDDEVAHVPSDQSHEGEVLLKLVDLVAKIQDDRDFSKRLDELHPNVEVCIDIGVEERYGGGDCAGHYEEHDGPIDAPHFP